MTRSVIGRGDEGPTPPKKRFVTLEEGLTALKPPQRVLALVESQRSPLSHFLPCDFTLQHAPANEIYFYARADNPTSHPERFQAANNFMLVCEMPKPMDLGDSS